MDVKGFYTLGRATYILIVVIIISCALGKKSYSLTVDLLEVTGKPRSGKDRTWWWWRVITG